MSDTGKKILVVDDEPSLCWALARILKGMDFVAVTACTGKEALALAAQTPFRLVFVDAKMPDMDGIELARRLKEIQKDPPIVLLSGRFYEEEDQVQAVIRDGLIRAFIGKPFRIEQVQETVEILTRGGHPPNS